MHEDGSISTTLHEEGVQRKSTMFDVLTCCKELASNIEEQLLAERIATLLATKLQPKNAADEIKEKIINALNDRKQEAPIE
jgi:hypothetical protein